ncbi:plasminogen-binding N-terminal domain-containing protein [Sulfurimonas sp.]
MKLIFLLTLITFELMGSLIKVPVSAIDNENNTLTIKIDKIDVGVSGFVVHHINDEHASILKNCVVESFDKKTKTAVIKLTPYDGMKNNALPHGEWKIVVGDSVELAFGYSRALLIAPSEEIYHKITKNVHVQWIHPDLFATTLSFAGHPTPLDKDFGRFSTTMSVGLLFIYLDKKVYTVDIKSFKILNITDAPFVQKSVKLPFYSRVENIEAAWWGEGSSELKAYAPHYYELLVKHNPTNKKLYEIVASKKQLKSFLDEFDLGK